MLERKNALRAQGCQIQLKVSADTNSKIFLETLILQTKYILNLKRYLDSERIFGKKHLNLLTVLSFLNSELKYIDLITNHIYQYNGNFVSHERMSVTENLGAIQIIRDTFFCLFDTPLPPV
jgi:hypothetical protein